MSEAEATNEVLEYRTPEQEQAAKGAGTPDPYDMALEDINPLNAHLFCDNRWQPVLNASVPKIRCTSTRFRPQADTGR